MIDKNRTARRHPTMLDNAGLSVVLLMGGRMADMIEQNRENIANEDAAGSCRARPHPQMLFSCYDGLAAIWPRPNAMFALAQEVWRPQHRLNPEAGCAAFS